MRIACSLETEISGAWADFIFVDTSVHSAADVGVNLAKTWCASNVNVDARVSSLASAVAGIVGTYVIVVAKVGDDGVVARGCIVQANFGIGSARVVVITISALVHAKTGSCVADGGVARVSAYHGGMSAHGCSRSADAGIGRASVVVIAIYGLRFARASEGIAALGIASIRVVALNGLVLARVIG